MCFYMAIKGEPFPGFLDNLDLIGVILKDKAQAKFMVKCASERDCCNDDVIAYRGYQNFR